MIALPKFISAPFTAGKQIDTLPPMIREAIARQQDESERLIGWIQLTILTVFAALYVADQNPFTLFYADTPPDPVPMFLGVFFAFTCLRLWWSYQTSLPFWFLLLSIVVDMSLLLGLIWTFHVEYAQPPSFYLKAPTLLYIFIFIALRALRFEPLYVLLSGAVASLGWLVMVGFAVADPVDAMITRDYVTYLTSNSILIGGEVDKVISIAMVTVVLSLAIARARRLLVNSIVEANTAANLSHFVPEGIADRIATAEGSLSDVKTEQREATIFFSDLVSFTKMSENLKPNELIITANEFFALASAVIQKYKGVIILFHGDAIMASFNLPSVNDDHAANAVAASLEIQRQLKDHKFSTGVKLKTRIGINTGEVVGGFAGASGLLNYTLYGDNVNIAARLEQLNKEHDSNILVSERTRELCGDERFAFDRKGEVVLRGRQAAIEVFTPVEKSV